MVVGLLQIHLMNPNPSTHGDVGWDWASQGNHPKGHAKVISRSQEGQISSESIGENSLFLLVLLQFSSLEMCIVVGTHLDPSMEL